MTLRNFLGAFHISLLQSARLHHLGGKALLTEPDPSYLVVVAASEEALYHYLKQRFAPDTSTHVILDRRSRSDAVAPERRRANAAHNLSIRRVAVIRLTDETRMGGATVTETAGQGRRMIMEGIEGLEDRQRVDRWLEESQYLIGRMIPAYLDDRDRVRGRLETSEHDNERLRGELTDARREISELRAELEFLRAERTSVSDSFSTIVEHLAALQKPINEVSRHLHNGQPSEIHA